MNNRHFVRLKVLALVLPVTLGLACLRRDWSVCEPPKAMCKPGFTCTDDFRCLPTDGGSSADVSSDGDVSSPADVLAYVSDAPAKVSDTATQTGGAGGARGSGGAVATAGTSAGGAAGGTGGRPGSDAPVATGGTTGGSSTGGTTAGSAGAPGSDAAVATGGTSSGGATGGTGGAGGSSALLTTGSKCTTASACSSGFCVDGVCCDKACAGCNACSQNLTGKADGTCAPATSGTDPHENCADETGANQCGNDGTCDGSGACRRVGTGHQCTASRCSGSTFTPASNCDGAGACKTVIPENCGAFQCSDTEGCKKSCAVQTDCGSQSYCNTSTGGCSVKKADGAACAQVLECSSNICVDGVCCNSTCTGCYACSTDLTGQPTGQCLPVSPGKTAHAACTASGTTCGLDGTCDGSGNCRYGASSTSCGSVCTGSTIAQKTCNGLGSCTAGIGTACPGSLVCSADGVNCRQTCTNNADCNSQSYCNTSTGACSAKLGPAEACTPTTVCASGNCVDGFCCESACSGTCQACSATKTGAANGLCRPVRPGTDPDSECAEATPNTCGLDGTCDGIGNCRYRDSTYRCGSSSCTGQGTFTDQGRCNGSGTCIAATSSSPCANNMLCASATTCATTCTDHSTTGCPSGYKCVGGNNCTVDTITCGSAACQLTNGQVCCETIPSNGNKTVPWTYTCENSVSCSNDADPTLFHARLACGSKADCAAGQVCCATGISCDGSGGPTGSGICAPYSAANCQGAYYNWGVQLCDPNLSPSECVNGLSCTSFANCVHGTYACQ